MAELDALGYLERQQDLGEELAKTLPPVPAQRFLLDRNAAKACRWSPELLLRGQSVRPLVSLLDLRWRDEVALQGAGYRFVVFFFVSLWHHVISLIGGIAPSWTANLMIDS
ncbi:MAG: hypothetical protein M3P26_06145 [Gemmatimonadota bacterium]|nr:hypothetical protein [Gemmatimonadota bacterium]